MTRTGAPRCKSWQTRPVKIKAAARIVRAALAGGLHGAAIAAAEEALPTIVKFAVGFVIAVVVIPMFVISAMPNMFFGYETSEKNPQITMREQALSIGGAYLSLEDFEKRSRTPSSPAKLPRMRIRALRLMRSRCPASLMKKISAGISPSTPSPTNRICPK